MSNISEEAKTPKFQEKLSKYAHQAALKVEAQCLPLGLIFALLFGLLVPVIGTTIGKKGIMSYLCIIIIFLITGLKLNTKEAMAALTAYKEILLGSTSILAITSLLGSFLTTLLPLNPPEFKTGLIIFFCTPCAVAYSVILTKQAGGNPALAVFLVVLCNTLGSFITPMIMSIFVKAGDVKLPVGDLVGQMVGTILAPLLFGKALQEIPLKEYIIRRTVTKWNRSLTFFSNTLLACIPFLKISDSAEKGTFRIVRIEDVCIMGAWFWAVHLLFLFVNYSLAWLICKDIKLYKAIVMTASTKTLPVTVTIISFLPHDFGDSGLLALPAIVCQFIQTMFDGVLASFWLAQTKAAEQKAAQLELAAKTTDTDSDPQNGLDSNGTCPGGEFAVEFPVPVDGDAATPACDCSAVQHITLDPAAAAEDKA